MMGLAIDPGMMNGVALFEWGNDQPFKRTGIWQFPGGAPALAAFLKGMKLGADRSFLGRELDALVMEKFTPRPQETFSLTLKAVEPLRGEGVVIGMGLSDFITWQQPGAQYFIGPPDLELAKKKKLAREFLKLHDLLPGGASFKQKDDNDAVSATLHAIAYLRGKRHMPTLEELFG